MISFWRQLKFLLWKGILVKKRQKFWLGVELLVPCILFVIIAIVRTRNFYDFREQCHFESKGMVSAGILPFMHSWLCSISNKCSQVPVTGDEREFLFNQANPNSTSPNKNESIVVNFLHYSSLQLQWIGEHPKEFDELSLAVAEAIHMIAKMNFTNGVSLEAMLPEGVREQFLNKFRAAREPLEKLMKGVIAPRGFLLLSKQLSEYSFLSPGLEAFCGDVSQFDAVFSKTEITSADRKILCQHVDPIDLGFAFKSLSDKLGPIASHLDAIYTFGSQQPLYEFWKTFGNYSIDDVKLAVTCGNSVQDIIDGMSKSDQPVLVETWIDRIRDPVAKFIQRVTPGQGGSTGDCEPINMHPGLNCSILEGPLLSAYAPIFSGYILVTPDTPATRKLVEKLNNPMQLIEYLRNLLYFYPQQAAPLQEALHDSDLWQFSQNVAKYLNETGQPGGEEIENVLEHVFGPPSDPKSFGNLTGTLVTVLNNFTSCFLLDRFRFVPTERDLEKNAMCLMNHGQFLSGLVFNVSKEFDKFTAYKIRHYADFVDTTQALMDSKSSPFSRHQPFRDLKYLTFGFSYLQEAIDRALIEHTTGKEFSIGTYVQQEPFPCFNKDTFNVSLFMPLFLLISFLLPSSLLVKNIVHEKEMRIKEQMRIMGLGDTVHFLSWAIISLALNTISILVISVILKVFRIFSNTDYTLLLLVLVLFMLSSIAMSLFFSTLFSNANISTAATSILWFIFFFPFQLQNDQIKTPTFAKITLIFPPTAMGYIFTLLAQFNEIEEASWSDIPFMYNSNLELSMTRCIVMLAVDVIVFVLLAWYISAVFPGTYGISQPWYFPVTPRYWFRNYGVNKVDDDHDIPFDDVVTTNENFEPEPTGSKMTVHTMGLSKVYDTGVRALDGLNLRLYEGQIMSLLGHNGAGKSTTMSLLCGLYEPSSGTANVYGRDIVKDMRRVREVLGVCPQHNVLFTHLTVSEQLILFAALKGVADEKLHEEVESVLNSVNLIDKADKLSGTLSGGMKRRLSIAIALVGGSKFVILDEPTAGVDVTARKDIWTMLQKNKEGRTMLLSTHHMDEADVLSDRIAILSEGELIALGSSMFMKKKFGDSFLVTILKKEKIPYKEIVERMIEDSAIELTFDGETDEELVFKLPISTTSHDLEEFFVKLDENLDVYRIGQYGISAPSMQDIFCKLAPQGEYRLPRESSWKWLTKLKKKVFSSSEDETDLIENGEEVHQDSDESFEDFERPKLLYGASLIWNHVRALLACRFQYMLRNKKVFLFQVILPLMMLVLCEAWVKIQTASMDKSLLIVQPAMPLETALFGNYTDGYIGNWDEASNSTATHLMTSLLDSPGMGTRCAEGEPNDYMLNARGCRSQDGNMNLTALTDSVPYNADVYCVCEDFGFNCTQEDWKWDETQYLILNTTERFFDMRGRNISQFRMVTRKQKYVDNFAPFIIGGYSLGHTNLRAMSQEHLEDAKSGWVNVKTEWKRIQMILGINITNLNPPQPRIVDPFAQNITFDQLLNSTIANLDTKENAKVWFNNKIWPALPIYSSGFSNAVLRSSTVSKPEQLGILTINHPMNETVTSSTTSQFEQGLAIFRIIMMIMVLGMIPAGFTVYLVEDRVNESLHLQLVGGLLKKTYWITNFFYDITIFMIASMTVLLIFFSFGVKAFSYDMATIGCFFLLFVLFGCAATVYSYVMQKAFNIPALSFIFISIGTYFVGTVCSLTVIMIENLMRTDDTLLPAYNICSGIFLIIPQFNLGMAVYRGAMINVIRDFGVVFLQNINREDLDKDLPLPHLLDYKVMGLYLITLSVHIVVAFALLIFTNSDGLGIRRIREKSYTKKLLAKEIEEMDEDVLKEKTRVDEMSATDSSSVLIVKNLAKAYDKTFLAVKGVTFAVEQGECFGLLGLNGAGKTTTFSMLTAKTKPGAGSIEVNGFSVSEGNRSGFQELGYCPQFDAMNMKLTTQENLVFFARIRGIQTDDIMPIVTRLLKALHLKPYANISSERLSGGNRRKLSVAISLLSQPSLVLLDEPSAGMDPSSQKFLWKVIGRLCASGKAVVLTSHSMEECEALCSKIAIMDRGKIRCLGGKQHLKIKFGKGYSLMMKVASVADARAIMSYVHENIPGTNFADFANFCNTVFIRIPQEVSSIANILKIVNELSRQYHIEDYSLSQSTLDEVFHSLAENKWENVARDGGSSRSRWAARNGTVSTTDETDSTQTHL